MKILLQVNFVSFQLKERHWRRHLQSPYLNSNVPHHTGPTRVNSNDNTSPGSANSNESTNSGTPTSAAASTTPDHSNRSSESRNGQEPESEEPESNTPPSANESAGRTNTINNYYNCNIFNVSDLQLVLASSHVNISKGGTQDLIICFESLNLILMQLNNLFCIF